MATGDRGKKLRLYLGVDVGGHEDAGLAGRGNGGDRSAASAIPRLATAARSRWSRPSKKPSTKLVKAKGVTPSDLTAMGIADPRRGRSRRRPRGRHPEHEPDRRGDRSAPGSPVRRARRPGQRLQPRRPGRDVARLGPQGRKRRGHLRRHGHRRRLRAARASCGAGRANRPARSATSIMQIDGPMCGCGNRGCLEALASRTAIETRPPRRRSPRPEDRAHRTAPAATSGVIRSGALRQALEAEDALVTEVMRRAAEVARLRLPQRPPPDRPRGDRARRRRDRGVQRLHPADRREHRRAPTGCPAPATAAACCSRRLGDDAVVLGAVALARKLVGRSPFKKRFAVTPELSDRRSHPLRRRSSSARRPTPATSTSRVDGNVKKRKKHLAREEYHTAHTLGPKELEKVCRGGPEILFVGTGESGAGEARATRPSASSASGRSSARSCPRPK